MTPQDIVPLLTGPTAALVICIWVIWWLRGDLKELRKANKELVRRADSAEEAARATNVLLDKLISHATGQRELDGSDSR